MNKPKIDHSELINGEIEFGYVNLMHEMRRWLRFVGYSETLTTFWTFPNYFISPCYFASLSLLNDRCPELWVWKGFIHFLRVHRNFHTLDVSTTRFSSNTHTHSLFRRWCWSSLFFEAYSKQIEGSKDRYPVLNDGHWIILLKISFPNFIGTNENLTNHLLWSLNCKKRCVHGSVLVTQTCNQFKSWYEIGVTIVINVKILICNMYYLIKNPQ